MRRQRLRVTVAMALLSLTRHRLQVGVALLSVIAGVASVIAMLAIAEGTNVDAQRRARGFGSTALGAESVEESQRQFELLFAAIAGTSLMIGGVGIMNIMLVTISERTKEIGIRRALGARRRHILEQFVIEAAVISAVGGLAGVVIGLTAPFVVSHFIGLPVVLRPESAVGAFAIAVAIGVIFGVYPARKAAMLDPAEALRSKG
jgi:ABC-type antimicrobial peptide transport system permease subunit